MPETYFLTSWLRQQSEAPVTAQALLADNPQCLGLAGAAHLESRACSSGRLSQWRGGEFLMSDPKSYVIIILVWDAAASLKILAFTDCLYHALKNDPRGVKANGFPVSPNSMQILASEISRSIRYIIPGVTAWVVLALSRSRDSFFNKQNMGHSREMLTPPHFS